MNIPTRPTYGNRPPNLPQAGSRPSDLTIILSTPAREKPTPPAGPVTRPSMSRAEALPIAPDHRDSISDPANQDMMNSSRNFLTVGSNLMAGCMRQIPGGQDSVNDLAAIVAGGCVRRILSGQDTGICTAQNLKEALAWLTVAQGFVAVICEEKLTDGEGRDLLRWLRLEKKNAIPFFLFCAQMPCSGRPEPGLELLGQPVHEAGLRESFCHFGLLPGPSRLSSPRFAGRAVSPNAAAEGGLSAFSPA